MAPASGRRWACADALRVLEAAITHDPYNEAVYQAIMRTQVIQVAIGGEIDSAGPGACTAKAVFMGNGTWSNVCVNALLTGLIGVVGTLLGSFTTYFFQSRTAKHDREFRRDERLKQEQLNACSAFAGTLAELKQTLVTLWFQRRRSQPIAGSGRPIGRRPGADGADTRAVRIECDRAGASAETARFRMQLVSGDPELMRLADSAFHAIGPIRSAAFGEEEPVTDLDMLREHETSFETSVQAFIKAASAQFRPAGSS